MGLTANSVLTSVEVFDGRLHRCRPVRTVLARGQRGERADSGLGRRYALRAAPFLAAVLLCALSPAIPDHTAPDVHWWLVAWGCLALVPALGALGASRPGGHWLQTLAPFLLLPAVQALRAADGDAKSGFGPMLVLITIWFALYGSRRDVALSVLGGAAVLYLPDVLVGAPRYPASLWRAHALLTLVLATVGALVHHLVATSERKTVVVEQIADRFRAVFDRAPVGLAVSARTLSDRERFVRVNDALCQILGYSEAELTAVPFLALIHPGDTADLAHAATSPEGSHGVEVRLIGRSGRVVWAHATWSLLPATHDEPDQLVWQIEDVTRRREADHALLEALELQRTATARLRDLDHARNDLVSSVAHDLRTPITAALGFAELLAEGEMGELSERQSETMTTINRSLMRLSTIMDELLTATATAAPDAERLDPVALSSTIHHAVQAVTPQARRRHQRVEVCDDLLGAQVAGDGARLERALINLLSNAVKFTPDGGRITVAASTYRDLVSIAISDTGPGIAETDHQRIFDRLYRAPRDGRQHVPGFALGLAIVKAIVTEHGGTIELASALGRGSTFTIRLPLRSC